MKFFFCALSALLLSALGECSRHYLLKGDLPETRNGIDLHYTEIRSIVESEIAAKFPNHSPVVSRIREKQQHSKKHAKQIEVELTLESEITDAIFEAKQARFTSYIETGEFEKLVDVQPEPYCYNEGYPGPNGTCICQDYFDGPRCEYQRCLNGGVSDTYLTIPQCICPPGYNDFFCDNRACRPPVQDDINPPSKNLIVLMPATTVFKPLREKILDNFEAMVNTLRKQDPTWIGTFVGGNYYSMDKGFMDNKIVMNYIITSNLTEFIERMRTIDGLKIPKDLNSWDQGMISAISVVLADALNGYQSGYPMIFAYSNTIDAKDWSLFGLDYQATYWRAKVFLNVINNSSAPMSTIPYDFRDYYQFSQNSHAPLFFYNIEDIDNVHTNVLPQLFKPQYIDVRSQTDCASGFVDVFRDYDDANQIVNVIVTINPPANNVNLTLTSLNGNLTLTSSYSSSNMAVYKLPSGWNGFNYQGLLNTTCSIYSWVSSDQTAIWAGHEDSHTDVGDIVTNAEAGYHFALTPVGTNQTMVIFDYRAIDSQNAQLIAPSNAYTIKPSCTLNYEFAKIPHCNPGPFTHQVQMLTLHSGITRVFPGVCVNTLIQNDDDQPITPSPAATTTASEYCKSDPQTCTVEGTSVFADDRNHPIRDFIFAVEWSDSDYRFINDAEQIIPSLLDSIYDVYYQQKFTFIIFNNVYATTLVSSTRRDMFETRVHAIIQKELNAIFSGWWNNTETTADSIDSVIMANLETLSPKAQVFVFTANPGTGSQPNLNKVLPKSIQVNYFYNSQIFDAYPFSVMTRQTNGRWFSASNPNFFVKPYLATTTELMYDVVYQNDEGAAVIHAFRVEQQANTIEVLINGAITNFTVTAASVAPLNTTTVISGTTGLSVIDTSMRGDDLYTLQVFCTYCTIQIRIDSPIQVILGFTSYPNDDTKIQTEPSAWLRQDTTQPYKSYVTARVTGLSANETVTSFTVSAHMGSLRGTSFTANTQGNINAMVANMRLRNSSFCSYQYIGEIDSDYEFDNWTPEIDGIQFVTKIRTDRGSEYTRIVYYYQPNELLDDFICQNGGTVNGYGNCMCTVNYTGGFCEVPVCQNGGRLNFGVCNCQDQYMGQFCETKITYQYVPPETTTTKQPTPIPTPPTSTASSTTPTPIAQNTTVTAKVTMGPSSITAASSTVVTTSQVVSSTVPGISPSSSTPSSLPSTLSTMQMPNTTVTAAPSTVPPTTHTNISNALSVLLVLLLSSILSVF